MTDQIENAGEPGATGVADADRAPSAAWAIGVPPKAPDPTAAPTVARTASTRTPT